METIIENTNLNEKEVEMLQTFATNTELVEVVRKVLLDAIYSQGVTTTGKQFDPRRNWALSLVWERTAPNGDVIPELSDEAIGSKLRAISEGLRFTETAIDNIKKFKVESKKLQAKKVNKAV